MKQLLQSKQFQRLLMKTQKRLRFCKKQWKKNRKWTLALMRNLTGIKFTRCFTVYISYPGLPGGRYLGEKGPSKCRWAIIWGGREDWKNYTTVYLWHEVLHAYFAKTDIAHAVIQLLTDNELRVRLNGGKYPPFIGHADLFPLMFQILPKWRQYLANAKPRNVFGLLESLKRRSYTKSIAPR